MRKALVLPVLAASLVFAPLAHAEPGDQISAEQAVAAIYKQVQRGCTPTMTSYLQSINWTEFYARSYGEGRIVDGTKGLGGPFKVYYEDPRYGPAVDNAAGRGYGQWSVDLEFC
ncbi:MAG: hypothetical protein QOE30_1960 [Mycobacterium sp.]|uniref:hypothetical protein n=1 Tax=Mycobacterium sp. TaxID=1785 RepID=UPI0028B7F70B|nr:hypothetical protein [Mycobacterium sp.]MDT5116221.1 hypothetical protein [Mycobacterium sp.]